MLTLARWNDYGQLNLKAVGLSHSQSLSLWLVLWVTRHSELSFGLGTDMARCCVPFPFLQSHTFNQFLLGFRNKWSPSEHFSHSGLQRILTYLRKPNAYTISHNIQPYNSFNVSLTFFPYFMFYGSIIPKWIRMISLPLCQSVLGLIIISTENVIQAQKLFLSLPCHH